MVRNCHHILKFVTVLYIVKFVDCFGTCLKPPAFISNWTDIVAQDPSLSEIVIRHDLGELPVKVDVQVKPVDKTSGKVDDFIFNGIGSAQRDDDFNDTYGGVVYIYNETTVTLIVPNSKNGFTSGYAVYTGDGIWSGPSVQQSRRAKVRVRIWREQDFPKPDFESTWTRVTSGQKDGSYLEIPHNVNTEPRYVSLQLKSDTTSEISDGVGSGTGYDTPKADALWGGVLYGYDKNLVRVWLPNSNSGKLFSASDGWGTSNRTWTSGNILVRVWKEFSDQIHHWHFGVKSNATNETLQTVMAGNDTVDLDKDIFLMEVQPQNGPNSQFLFKGTGATENANMKQTYGSFMYSYSATEVRMYHPPFPILNRANGLLLDISNIWGNGTNNQQTNDVKLRVEIIQPASFCPTTTTTTTTTPSPSQITKSGTTSKASPTRKFTALKTKSKTPGTTAPLSSVTTESRSGGLSPAAGAGIGVGVAALLLGSSACLIWGLLKRRNKKKRSVEDIKENEDGGNKGETEESSEQRSDDVNKERTNTEGEEQQQQQDSAPQTNET